MYSISIEYNYHFEFITGCPEAYTTVANTGESLEHLCLQLPDREGIPL